MKSRTYLLCPRLNWSLGSYVLDVFLCNMRCRADSKSARLLHPSFSPSPPKQRLSWESEGAKVNTARVQSEAGRRSFFLERGFSRSRKPIRPNSLRESSRTPLRESLEAPPHLIIGLQREEMQEKERNERGGTSHSLSEVVLPTFVRESSPTMVLKIARGGGIVINMVVERV